MGLDPVLALGRRTGRRRIAGKLAAAVLRIRRAISAPIV